MNASTDPTQAQFWLEVQIGQLAIVDGGDATAEVTRRVLLTDTNINVQWLFLSFKRHNGSNTVPTLLALIVHGAGSGGGALTLFVLDTELVSSRSEVGVDSVFFEPGAPSLDEAVFATAIHHDESNLDYVLVAAPGLCEAQVLPPVIGAGSLQAFVASYASEGEPSDGKNRIVVFEGFSLDRAGSSELIVYRGREAASAEEFDMVPMVSQ
jgi:hypothetical protein